jgi:hypothetical protein
MSQRPGNASWYSPKVIWRIEVIRLICVSGSGWASQNWQRKRRLTGM